MTSFPLKRLLKNMSSNDAYSDIDQKYMAEALGLAEKGCFTSTPNPRVGCVIVAGPGSANEKVVGRGWHKRAGEAHAEILALREAGSKAHGATVYVTLEPCCVTGQTGPCTEALIEAGVKRVVFAMPDPNPDVDGAGQAALQVAGIETSSGVLTSESAALNKGFIKRMQQGRPWVTGKTASSLDGRSAMASGESRWITGEKSRQEVQRLRARSCAIVTGVDTILADNPSLNVRSEDLGFEVERQPTLVVLDSQLRTPDSAAIFSASASRRVYIASTRDAVENPGNQQIVAGLQAAGAELWSLESNPQGRVNLNTLMNMLAENAMNEVLLESGPTLLGSFLQAGLVDELAAFIAPKLMGSEARPMAVLPIDELKGATRFELFRLHRFGDDILAGYINPDSKHLAGME